MIEYCFFFKLSWPVPRTRSVIETTGAGRAGSGEKSRRGRAFFPPDPARPASVFSIDNTDREPGTGYYYLC